MAGSSETDARKGVETSKRRFEEYNISFYSSKALMDSFVLLFFSFNMR